MSLRMSCNVIFEFPCILGYFKKDQRNINLWSVPRTDKPFTYSLLFSLVILFVLHFFMGNWPFSEFLHGKRIRFMEPVNSRKNNITAATLGFSIVDDPLSLRDNQSPVKRL